MFPAQPPNSRRMSGTRKDTFRMCTWCGRMWSAKRPSKTMMESYAMEPQISVLMMDLGLELPAWLLSARPW